MYNVQDSFESLIQSGASLNERDALIVCFVSTFDCPAPMASSTTKATVAYVQFCLLPLVPSISNALAGGYIVEV